MERTEAITAKAKIRHFTDLHAWQEGHTLVLEIYKFAARLPNVEQFSLASQLRRAAISITSNIAEGFGRNSAAEKFHFYTIAHTSLMEVQNQLFVARDVLYLTGQEFTQMYEQTESVSRLINGLLKSCRANVRSLNT